MILSKRTVFLLGSFVGWFQFWVIDKLMGDKFWHEEPLTLVASLALSWIIWRIAVFGMCFLNSDFDFNNFD